MDLAKVEKLAGRPAVFTPGTNQMWSDTHISRFMLEAHLDPELEAASRRQETISASIKWLLGEIIPRPLARILDLGCGPGLYSLPLAHAGYEVLGVDISSRSINYARKQAQGKILQLEYRELDYRELDFNNYFDVVLLIYCDLGALDNPDRDLVLEKIFQALRPGGLFVFDVFTPKRRGKEAEGKSWEVAREGFWSPLPHLVLSETFFYPEEDTFLDQHLVIEENGGIKTYRIWDHVYTRETLKPLLEKTGFKTWEFFGDITGKAFTSESETVAVMAKK